MRLIPDLLLDPIVHDTKLDRIIELAKPFCMNIPRSKKHVSIILRKGRMLALGTNAFKGHPMASKLGYRFGEQHSELNALLKCSQRDKLILVNVRFNKLEQLRMARPCPLCLPWCVGLFDEVYYTCPVGNLRRLTVQCASVDSATVDWLSTG